VGVSALAANTSGAGNTALGDRPLFTNLTGSSNTAVGSVALYASTGDFNTAVGAASLRFNTASNNTAVGYQAGYTNSTGASNVYVGTLAGKDATSNSNVFVGKDAGLTVSSGGGNTYIGFGSGPNVSAGTGTTNAMVGYLSGNKLTTGSNNTSLGGEALISNTTASNNTAVGYQAGYTNQTGDRNTFLGTLAGNLQTNSFNTFVGARAGLSSTGERNTFVGAVSLEVSVANYGCGELMTTGSKNTILGGFNGNQGGLDIRTASNYIVLSDGDGNPRGVFGPSGQFGVAGANYGTSGQVLTSGGSGAAPTWAATSMTLLSTVTANASATVDVETTFSSTYDAYMLVISGATPDTDSVQLLARMKIGGSYISTSSYISLGGTNSTSGSQLATLATSIVLVTSVWGNDAASSCDVVMYIFNPSSTAFRKQISYQATSTRIDTGATQIQTRFGSGSNDGTGALTGMRFFASSGNISAGKFRLYGIANS
jgi:hypothetical protein